MDIFPTVAEILKLPKSSMTSPIDGISLTELFKSDLKSREKPIPFRWQNKAALVDNNFKLIATDISKNEFELYDLSKDPTESNNIIVQEKEVADKMIEVFKEWNQSVENSVKGKDYLNGLIEPNGYNVFWNTLPEYKPYFDQWKDRPEYKATLKDMN
jgi:hypothetical protein